MHHDALEFRGSYRYANPDELDRALAAACAHIVDDELADREADWLRSFVRRGTTLQVHAALPAAADRFLAAEVLQLLASSAIEGVVDISQRGRCVDSFPSEPPE